MPPICRWRPAVGKVAAARFRLRLFRPNRPPTPSPPVVPAAPRRLRADITVGGAEEAPGPQASAGLDQLFQANVKDAFFDFNKSDIRGDARDALLKTAEFLRSYPQIRVSIEGHCDDRGSTEYNLGLGQRRAQSARDYLVSLGIPAERMETVSWGKDVPSANNPTKSAGSKTAARTSS